MSTQISSVPRASVPANQRVALRCAGLVKRFTDVTAVNGLDLEVFAGECFGLLGPNGAGKTTTVEILEGLTPSDEGTVELLGQHWNSGNDRGAARTYRRSVAGDTTGGESDGCRDGAAVSQFLPARSRC